MWILVLFHLNSYEAPTLIAYKDEFTCKDAAIEYIMKHPEPDGTAIACTKLTLRSTE
jgi:hypothetical protein